MYKEITKIIHTLLQSFINYR